MAVKSSKSNAIYISSGDKPNNILFIACISNNFNIVKLYLSVKMRNTLCIFSVQGYFPL